MIDLKESIAGAEAILRHLWESVDLHDDEHVIKTAYAEAYGFLKQGVIMYLEEQARDREDRRFEEEIDD